MSRFFLVFCILIFAGKIEGQIPTKPSVPATSNVEQQLENITENNDDSETEDDSYLQELLQYQKNPVNINTASENLLRSLRILNPMQIVSLLNYRNYLGKLIDLYELQSVPGWDLTTIQKIKPYITISDNNDLITSLKNRFQKGDKTLLVRVSQVLEKSKGYLVDPASGKNFYPGSPQKLLVRYRYNYKNTLQYGVLGEKDAGEQFFKGAQKQGFDFYSAHIFAKNVGVIRSLAVGDFTVNLGQGLTQWMNLAFKKGPDILSTKRQADVIRPYNSAGEINFHRGVGITVAKNKWEATLFTSYKKVDANFAKADTTTNQEDFITSLQISGFHRTKAESADKGIQRQLAFGGNVAFQQNNFHIGLNGVQYIFKLPLFKQSQPYNLYALSGKQFGNYSTDYSYTYKNIHVYGEAAVTDKFNTAFVNGILISTAANVDMSFVYRNISKKYQSLYSNAFTENTYPTNEKGLFSGISVKLTDAWRVDAYFDYFKFPWLKFRVNAPSTGSDFFAQLTYKPNKLFEIYTRYKTENKSINYNPDNLTISPVIQQPRMNWRNQFSYKLTPSITLRSRTELVWFDKKGRAKEKGFLMYADVLYNPTLKPFAANIRLQYFETDGFNSRLYAYENDVLYSFSIPLFFNQGYRFYLNVNYDVTKKVTVWVKLGQFLYKNQTNTGSALDEIDSPHKTELKFQAIYKF